MRSDELTVEVRDANLRRVGILLPQDRLLRAKPAFNGAGEWSLEVPAEHPMAAELRKPGSGIIVTGPDDVWWSGPVTQPATEAGASDVRGMLKATGVTDSVILVDAAAWPQPSNGDATTQTLAYDARTGAAETLMHAYVSANIGPDAPASRRGRLARQLVMGTNSGRGTVFSKRARFANLADLLAEIAAVDGLGFRVVQRGDALVFEVTETTDRTAELRLDVRNGGLASQKVATTPPTVTRVYVAGQGEGADRTIRTRTSPEATAAENEWGRVVERFKDQRQTDDLDELDQAGDEDLADGGSTATNVAVVPADEAGQTFGRDWDLGDRVTVVIDGQETTSTITSAPVVDVGKGLRVGMGLGDPAGFSRSAALTARVEDTEQRVSALERNTETPVDLTTLLEQVRQAAPLATRRISELGDAVDLNTVTETGVYRQGLTAQARTGTNYPEPIAGLLEVFAAGSMKWQRYTTYGSFGTAYARGWYNNTWSAWEATLASPDGSLALARLRVTAEDDATATSTGHPLQIGPDGGANLRLDGNELTAVTNGVISTLYLNPDGGHVIVGNNTSSGIRLDNNGNLVFQKNGGQVEASAGGPNIGIRDGNSYAFLIGEDSNGPRCWSSTPLIFDRTYTSNASMVITSAGTLGRSTSLRAAKVEIEDAPSDWAEKVYALRPRTWLDRGTVEHYAELLDREEQGEVIDWSTEDCSRIDQRIPGFVAEEVVEDAGLPEFGTYDNDGHLSGLAYDRLTAALVATVQQQKAQLDAQAQQISDLVAAVAALQNGAAS